MEAVCFRFSSPDANKNVEKCHGEDGLVGMGRCDWGHPGALAAGAGSRAMGRSLRLNLQQMELSAHTMGDCKTCR